MMPIPSPINVGEMNVVAVSWCVKKISIALPMRISPVMTSLFKSASAKAYFSANTARQKPTISIP